MDQKYFSVKIDYLFSNVDKNTNLTELKICYLIPELIYKFEIRSVGFSRSSTLLVSVSGCLSDLG